MGKPSTKTNGEQEGLTAIISQYERSLRNPLTLVLKAHEGLNAGTLDNFAVLSGLGRDILSAFLNISPKTLSRYKRARKKLNSENSEQVLKWISMYKKGIEMFGSIRSFNTWLRKPSYGLGNYKPISLMGTSTGVDLLIDELLRIEYGDLA